MTEVGKVYTIHIPTCDKLRLKYMAGVSVVRSKRGPCLWCIAAGVHGPPARENLGGTLRRKKCREDGDEDDDDEAA